jgi:hypothetical protein
MAGAVGHELLDDVRHAVEWPLGRQRRIVVEIGDRVQRGVEAPQVGQRRVEHLLGAELARANQLGDGERIVRRKQVVHFG